MVGTALAQTESCDLSGPESLEDCEDPSLNPFEALLQNLYDIANALLQYLGFVAVFAGSTLYLTADSNSDRAQTGLWLFVGGLMLIILYFGMSAFLSLVKGIATGGEM
jgi:hypothetical protein